MKIMTRSKKKTTKKTTQKNQTVANQTIFQKNAHRHVYIDIHCLCYTLLIERMHICFCDQKKTTTMVLILIEYAGSDIGLHHGNDLMLSNNDMQVYHYRSTRMFSYYCYLHLYFFYRALSYYYHHHHLHHHIRHHQTFSFFCIFFLFFFLKSIYINICFLY